MAELLSLDGFKATETSGIALIGHHTLQMKNLRATVGNDLFALCNHVHELSSPRSLISGSHMTFKPGEKVDPQVLQMWQKLTHYLLRDLTILVSVVIIIYIILYRWNSQEHIT